MVRKKSRSKSFPGKLAFSAGGALVGYFVFHPYAMLVYSWMHRQETGGFALDWKNLFGIALETFQPMMFPMAAAFVLLGGAIGLLAGIVVDKKREVAELERRTERKRVALETLHRLMVTLSHYLLNANMVIGGRVSRARKKAVHKETLASLEIIEEQARKIDAVIAALKRITEMKTTQYTDEDHDLMLDIAVEVEDALNKTEHGKK